MKYLQVFLSSAMTGELKSERQTLRTLFQVEPTLKEFYELYAIEDHSGPHDIETTYLDEVNDSSVFIVLFKEKLREAVKKEFLEAKEKGKKIFAYVCTDDSDRSEELKQFILDEVYSYTAGMFHDAVDLSQKIKKDLVRDLLKSYEKTLANNSSEQSFSTVSIDTSPSSEYHYYPLHTIIELAQSEEFRSVDADQLEALALVWIDVRGNYKEALLLIELAMHKLPNNWVHYHNRGVILESMGLDREAYHSFRKALELNPESDSTLYHIGRHYYLAGRTEDAIKELKKSIEKNEDREKALHYLFACYLSKADYTEALVWAKMAVEKFPGDVSYSNLVLSLSLLKQFDEALQLADSHIQDEYEMANSKAKVYYKMEKFDKALAETNTAIGDGTSDYNLVILKLFCLSKSGRIEEAITWLQQIDQQFPILPNDYNDFGYELFSRFEKLDLAESLFRKAVKLEPNLMVAWNNLQALLGQSKRFDEGIQACQDALNVNRYDNKSIENMSIMLMYSGKVRQAIDFQLEHTIENSPGDFDKETLLKELKASPHFGVFEDLINIALQAKKAQESESWADMVQALYGVSKLNDKFNKLK